MYHDKSEPIFYKGQMWPYSNGAQLEMNYRKSEVKKMKHEYNEKKRTKQNWLHETSDEIQRNKMK